MMEGELWLFFLLQVLQRCREKEWSQRATVLSELKALSEYSPRDLMVLNSNAKYESYPPNSVCNNQP